MNKTLTNIAMNRAVLLVLTIVLILTGCEPEKTTFTIKGTIKGAEGKYLKFINMTKPGLRPDSLMLDLAGRFSLTEETREPKDFIFYIKPEESIRITPGVNEVVEFSGKASNLVKTYQVKGSQESEWISEMVKSTYNAVQVIDTLDDYYLKNQLNPQLDTVVAQIQDISDSVYHSQKAYLTSFIETRPGTLASYVALSQKLGHYRNFFTLANDFKYFEMVDTALLANYDTITMVKMLDGYIKKYKSQQRRLTHDIQKNMIGEEAPEIHQPNVWGDSLKLSDLRGKYVLVDFWGSWCRPCRTENANLRTAYRRYRYKGFEIFQVALERNKSDWKNTIREDKLYWRYQVSELNYMDSEVARKYHVMSVPANYLINPEGTIVAKNLYGKELLDKLNEVFNPETSAQN